MAKKEDKKEKKVVLERTYVIPLRKKYRRAPNWRRTPRAVSALREFVIRHMKAKEVKIGEYLNLKLWERGMKNPIHKVKVDCVKDEDGTVKVELFGAPKEEQKKEKEQKKKKIVEEKEEPEIEIRVKDALEGKEDEIKEDKRKEIEKEEIKELKKEHRKIHSPRAEAIPKKVEPHQTAPLGR